MGALRYEEAISPLMRQAGERILSAVPAGGGVEEKGGDAANLVTAYDRAVQDMLEEALLALYPEACFMAEEQENDPAVLSAPLCFVIDPIDGTANFVHGYRRSAISLAVLEHGVTVFGAVYDPYLDELFTATRGGGARLNGRTVRVADRPPEEGLAVFGTCPYYKERFGAASFALGERIFYKTRDVRRSGTAALDLAYVAAGRCDMFFELTLSPWDIAAGILLVREAGGVVTDPRGGEPRLDRRVGILAASPACHPYLLAEMAGILSEYHL